ncbi:MAG: glycerophosphoryl diester phosphodiesterase membrane domain-containing protein [Atopobiaceae bacterium]|nr:glycerophosphoryl diester phosphodiesterase membrane domain-containing protein [Atopobiaceae bacterium]
MRFFRSLRSYLQAIPHILSFQCFVALLLEGMFHVLNTVAAWALLESGRVAVTSGDFSFLFTSWQGILLIALALITLFLSFALEVVLMVKVAGRWVRNEEAPLRETVRESLMDAVKFLSPYGMPVVLYITIMAPLVGFGVSVSLTQNMYIPNFITSVVRSNPLYNAAYSVVVFCLFLAGFFNIFIVHGVVLDGLSIKEAYANSRKLMRKNWLNYTISMAIFSLVSLLLFVLANVVPLLLYPLMAFAFQNVTRGDRIALLTATFIVLFMTLLFFTLFPGINFFRLTTLYETYRSGSNVDMPLHRKTHHPAIWLMALVIVASSLGLGYLCDRNFDTVFPRESSVKIIAHRAGGSESVENTAIALNTAAEHGAWGAEIDIQRTADGFYIVNHDDDFARVAGDSRTPSQMTLEEIQTLRVKNTSSSGEPDQPVSTYEEMLDGARDRLVLLVELKGATADKQMADDAIRIAREKGMLDQCIFISLKYDLIRYIEDTYPDVQTGFLAFASYGDIAGLDTDYLALEEETSQRSIINAIHSQGKGIFVWTVNGKDEQRYFLQSGADAIITDNISQAEQLKQGMATRSDMDRILDWITTNVLP